MLWGVRQRVEPAGDNFLRGFIIAWGFMRSQIVTSGKKKGTEFLLGLFFFMQLVFFYIFSSHFPSVLCRPLYQTALQPHRGTVGDVAGNGHGIWRDSWGNTIQI